MENKNCQPDSFASFDEIQIWLIEVNCVELMTFINCLIPFGIIFLNCVVYARKRVHVKAIKIQLTMCQNLKREIYKN